MSRNRLVVNSNFFSRNNHLSSLIYWNHYRDSCISASVSLPLYTGLVWDYSSHKSWDAAWRSLPVLDAPLHLERSPKVSTLFSFLIIFMCISVLACLYLCPMDAVPVEARRECWVPLKEELTRACEHQCWEPNYSTFLPRTWSVLFAIHLLVFYLFWRE